MKNLTQRALALAACGALMLSLAACGSSAESEAESEAASSEASDETAVETDPIALAAAEFSYADGLDENGYFEGVKALDLVTLPADYMSITIPAAEVAVADEEIQETIDSLLAEYPGSEKDTESAVAEGDLVNIDYVGSVDGVEFVGGTTNGQGTNVTAGASNYIDDFLTQIIGHKPGETFDVLATFPEGYADGKDADGNTVVLENKEAKFVVTINYITREVPAVWNDEFVANYINPEYGTTAAEFTETLRRDMAESKRMAYIQNYLTDNTVFPEELPQEMLDYNLMTVLKYYHSYASSYGMTLSAMLQTVEGCTVPEYVEKYQEDLVTATRQTLLVQAICEDNGIIGTDADLEAAFPDEEARNAYLENYGRGYLMMGVNSSNALQLVSDNAQVK